MVQIETKAIKGHGGGTNMEWLCTAHKDAGYGFGDEPALTCVDMTVHAPEHSRPSVVFSTYRYSKDLSLDMLKTKFNRDAYQTWEQLAFAKKILEKWDKLKKFRENIDVGDRPSEER